MLPRGTNPFPQAAGVSILVFCCSLYLYFSSFAMLFHPIFFSSQPRVAGWIVPDARREKNWPVFSLLHSSIARMILPHSSYLKHFASNSQLWEQTTCQAPHNCQVTLTCVIHQSFQIEAFLFNIHEDFFFSNSIYDGFPGAGVWGALFRDGLIVRNIPSVSLGWTEGWVWR